MDTLKEANESFWESQEKAKRMLVSAGVLCDKCGGIMVFSSSVVTFWSRPLQRQVHCPGCGHKGLLFID